MDTEFSGFSVPLEHSFEAGEKVSLLFYYHLLCDAFLSMLAAKLTELSCANSDNTRERRTLHTELHLSVWMYRYINVCGSTEV